MERVLITGVRGFTGRYLVERLQAEEYEVHGITRAEDVGQSPLEPAFLHYADLGDCAGLAKILAKIRPDKIVHLAGIAFVDHGNAEEIYRANLVASRNLLQAVVESRIRPPLTLLASSANVYGNRRSGAIDESFPPSPLNDYALSKLATEFAARIYHDRVPVIIVRPFNYTGVGQSPEFVIPKIVEHVRRRAVRIELGNIDIGRDFSDVRGVVDAYVRLLSSPAAVSGTFNVCSGTPYSLRQILHIVEQISGHSMKVDFSARFTRVNEVHTLYGSNAKLQGIIGRLNMPSLEETLRWMIEA